MYKQEKGITLVALVITIIVLLILAGVTIALVLNGGILDKAQAGTKAYSEAAIKEQIELAIGTVNAEYYDPTSSITKDNASMATIFKTYLTGVYGDDATFDITTAHAVTMTLNNKIYTVNLDVEKKEANPDLKLFQYKGPEDITTP